MGIRIRTDVGLLMDDGAGDRIVGYIDSAGRERNLDGSPRVAGSTAAVLGSASEVSSTPTGDVSATTVQAAIAELAAEKLPLAGGTVAGTLTVTGFGGLGSDVIFENWASMPIRCLRGIMSYLGTAAFAGNLYYTDTWRYAKNGAGFVLGTDGSGNFTIALAPSNASGAGIAATVTPTAIAYADGSIGTLLSTGAIKMAGSAVISSDRLLLARALTIATLSSVTNVNGAIAFVTDLGGGPGLVYCDGAKWIRVKEAGQQTIATDAALTLAYLTNAPSIVHTGTLTADRAITLSTTNAVSGARFRVTRKGGGAFNLSVGGLKSLWGNTWCDVEYDGSAWVLTAYGSLIG